MARLAGIGRLLVLHLKIKIFRFYMENNLQHYWTNTKTPFIYTIYDADGVNDEKLDIIIL